MVEKRRGQAVLLQLYPPLRLNRRQAAWFVLVFALPSMIIATGWALLGAWPVFPFMGLEVVVVAAVLFSVARKQCWQEILLEDEKVTVRDSQGRRHTFSRHWLRSQQRGERLFLGSHGFWIEVGAFLTAVERQILAAKLNDLLREGE